MEDNKNQKKQNYDNEYIKNNKDRINFVMDKGTKERIMKAAARINISKSEFLRQAINEKLDKIEAAAADPEVKEIKIETKYY